MTAGRLAFGAFLLCSVVWGSTFIAIREANETVPPLWGATLRLVIAAPLLALIALGRGARWPTGPALGAVAAFGALQFGGNFSLLYWGEQWVPGGVAAVLFATIPLSTMLFAAMVGLERLDGARTAAAAAAFAGVAVVFAGETLRDVPLVALAAVLLAATSAAFSGVLLKRAPPQDVFALNAVAAAIGAVICLGASAAAGETRAIPATWAEWWPILYLALAGSIVAFVTFAWLLARWRVTSVSMVAVVIPIVALALGFALRGETVPPLSAAGAALVVVGVAVVLRLQAREAAGRPSRDGH